jgi:hypothetical protein
LALKALEIMTQPVKTNDETTKYKAVTKAITALRKALAEQPAQKRPQNCGTSYCSCIECVMEPAQQEPPCKTGGQCISKCQQCAVQEPVAWVCYGAPGKRDIDFEEADINKLPIGTQLYTTPPAQPAPVEPLEYWNAVEGWVKIDEVRKHFDSVGCGTIYKTAGDGRVPLTAAQRQWVGLTDEEYVHITDTVFHQGHGLVAYYLAIEAKLKELNT